MVYNKTKTHLNRNKLGKFLQGKPVTRYCIAYCIFNEGWKISTWLRALTYLIGICNALTTLLARWEKEKEENPIENRKLYIQYPRKLSSYGNK